MRKTTIHGYSDRMSVAPGETITFMVSCEEPGTYRADVVRLIHGDTNPAGPGFKEEVVQTAANREYPGRFQPTHSGSHVVVGDPAARLHQDGAFTLHAFIQPTTPAKGRQGLLTRFAGDRRVGYGMAIDRQGRLALWLGDGAGGLAELSADTPLLPWVWYSAAVSFDPASGRATVYQEPVVNPTNSLVGPVSPIRSSSYVEARSDVRVADAGVPFVIAGYAESGGAGDPVVGGHYNGKLDRPRVYGRALSREELDALTRGDEPGGAGPLARWDFAAGIGPNGIPTDHVADTSGNGLHGACVNMPARGMTGYNWTAREENFKHAPQEYGAIHFHDDDLDDCRWQADFTLTIPQGLKSDVYAVRLRLGESEDYVPFFVLPPRGTANARILLLVPTASYMAYANDHIVLDSPVAQAILGHTSAIAEQDVYLYTHTEFGLSTYDLHSDGSGVCYTSRRRPIVNLRPKFRHAAGSVWQFPADLHLVDWLNAKGFAYDVATDEELHQEGLDLLKRYKVVLTGSHPEYYSEAMLAAWEQYLAGGGRGMYMGSNGFYWIISYHPEKPWLLEVRKGESGSRAWQAKPGEYHHSTSGERGGLWRNRARPPQKIFGVGFTSEGFDDCSYYRQMPDARDPRGAWIFEGVGPDELIGDFGLAGGGAAGYEIDRYELALGTPPNALLLAASEGHSDNYPHVVEEIFFNYPGLGGTQDPQVRADLVYFTTPNGGAMFSTGSISYCGSLSHNNYDNNVSKITENVLRRFAADEPPP
jgi:N,N-dimethylformamidase